MSVPSASNPMQKSNLGFRNELFNTSSIYTPIKAQRLGDESRILHSPVSPTIDEVNIMTNVNEIQRDYSTYLKCNFKTKGTVDKYKCNISGYFKHLRNKKIHPNSTYEVLVGAINGYFECLMKEAHTESTLRQHRKALTELYKMLGRVKDGCPLNDPAIKRFFKSKAKKRQNSRKPDYENSLEFWGITLSTDPFPVVQKPNFFHFSEAKIEERRIAKASKLLHNSLSQNTSSIALHSREIFEVESICSSPLKGKQFQSISKNDSKNFQSKASLLNTTDEQLLSPAKSISSK